MDYVEKINLENKRKLQGLLKELPKFCADFFRYLDTRNQAVLWVRYPFVF